MIRFPFRAAAALASALALTVTCLPTSPAFADSIRAKQWYLADLDVTQAHRITEGAGVTVALIDTGVTAGQQDLRGAVTAGTVVDTGAGGDGRTDKDGHGTEMAGLIAGRGHGSGDGVLGIAPQAKILPIGVPLNTLSSGDYMTGAIDFAIAHHAGVINMSFGTSDDNAMHAAIRKAVAADIVLVAGSGNEDKSGEYPGRYPEVLTVGAYDRGGKIASFSISGPQVDVAAPGVDIVTTSNRSSDDYFEGDGTSPATAIVSGAVALLRAKYPSLSAADIVHRLTATAIDAGPKGRDDSYGYGRLDIVKALTAELPPIASPSVSSTTAPAGSTAADADALPSAKSAAWLVAVVVGIVLLLAIFLAVVFVARGRRIGRGS